jgi:ferritin-like metal-binding protein YciE
LSAAATDTLLQQTLGTPADRARYGIREAQPRRHFKETTMTKLKSLDDLLVHELQDIYHAEGQILKALPKMIKAATHHELQAAFEEHLEQTEGHVQRLEQAFKLLGVPAKAKKCDGMAGLIEEGKKMMEADAEPSVKDAALIAAAQKVEHYEIASYGCVCTYAEMLGYDKVHDLLGQNLDEEETADERLSALAESVINVEAEDAGDIEAEEEASR